MKPQTTGTTPADAFTITRWEALRLHYQQDQDLWNAHELAQLRFLRWLYRTNRLGVGHGARPPHEFAGKEVPSPDMLNQRGI
jgi:hypothetical protein